MATKTSTLKARYFSDPSPAGRLCCSLVPGAGGSLSTCLLCVSTKRLTHVRLTLSNQMLIVLAARPQVIICILINSQVWVCRLSRTALATLQT